MESYVKNAANTQLDKILIYIGDIFNKTITLKFLS